jgi:hypothetical protein
MKRFFGLMIMSSSLFGWGTTQPEIPVVEVKKSQDWLVKESYLILKPYEDDTDYASKLTVEGSLDTELEMSMKLEKPDFDWSSGVRLGIGRYLPKHDEWDITLFTTYYYAQEKNQSHPNREKGTLLTPLWNPTFDGGATDGKMVWRLNFFNWDLSLGRVFNLLKTITAHPFFGLRAALIYKDYLASYSDTNLRDRFKASDTFWGIGPRAGVDFDFKFTPGWSFLGNLSAAIFYGEYTVEEKTSSLLSTGLTRYRNLDHRYCVRANLDTALGIGWEVWLKNRTVRIAPTLLFEASCWFDTNQLFVSQPTASSGLPLPTFQNFRREGNLILMGFSLNLQTDF